MAPLEKHRETGKPEAQMQTGKIENHHPVPGPNANLPTESGPEGLFGLRCALKL